MAAADGQAGSPTGGGLKELTRAQMEFMQTHNITQEDLQKPGGVDDRRGSVDDAIGTCAWPPLYDTKFVESLKAEQMQGEVSRAPRVEGLAMSGVEYKRRAMQEYHQRLEDRHTREAEQAALIASEPKEEQPVSPDKGQQQVPITGDVDYKALGHDPSQAQTYRQRMMENYRSRKAQGRAAAPS
eukprot:TRINITY_DN3311_c0_g1_i1.p1 TRINITY_DN3311_c0_g1~~TRINITY_DN3311_c0_g1_i1.p1  ORF type:complete len:204 (+),score=91.78 TRINITY_DN3311_c0_g1_i1:61-612(+)